MKIAVVFGTRPEAIKMAPVVRAIKARAAAGFNVQPLVYVSAQHRELLDQVLDLFEICPHADLDVMTHNQGLAELTSRILTGIHDLFRVEKPDLVLVHGDTTTAFAAALAAFYTQVPVGHVEAGLRTRNRYSPFPEELNRQLVDTLCTYHFAPTAQAVANLRAESVASEAILQTGNTVIDALLWTLAKQSRRAQQQLLELFPMLAPALQNGRRFILVTSHRRENFGAGMRGIFEALLDLVHAFPDLEIIYPVHPNPNVRAAVAHYLANRARIHLLPPLAYPEFCYLMSAAHLILSDSGGVQEEAPSLDRPVLVLRDTSERPEAIAAGAVRLVGTHRTSVYEAAARLLTNEDEYRQMAAAENPYGDGHAADRIADFILSLCHAKKVG